MSVTKKHTGTFGSTNSHWILGYLASEGVPPTQLQKKIKNTLISKVPNVLMTFQFNPAIAMQK